MRPKKDEAKAEAEATKCEAEAEATVSNESCKHMNTYYFHILVYKFIKPTTVRQIKIARHFCTGKYILWQLLNQFN